MDNLRYYFDVKKGVTETYAKQKFQQMLQNNDNQTDVFNTIWENNLGLRESLFPRPAGVTDDDVYKDLSIQRFRTLVSTLDDTFFGFIKTK